jgi:hypothetical protein
VWRVRGQLSVRYKQLERAGGCLLGLDRHHRGGQRCRTGRLVARAPGRLDSGHQQAPADVGDSAGLLDSLATRAPAARSFFVLQCLHADFVGTGTSRILNSTRKSRQGKRLCWRRACFLVLASKLETQCSPRFRTDVGYRTSTISQANGRKVNSSIGFRFWSRGSHTTTMLLLGASASLQETGLDMHFGPRVPVVRPGRSCASVVSADKPRTLRILPVSSVPTAIMKIRVLSGAPAALSRLPLKCMASELERVSRLSAIILIYWTLNAHYHTSQRERRPRLGSSGLEMESLRGGAAVTASARGAACVQRPGIERQTRGTSAHPCQRVAPAAKVVILFCGMVSFKDGSIRLRVSFHRNECPGRVLWPGLFLEALRTPQSRILVHCHRLSLVVEATSHGRRN